jgi:hypothetical protein
VYFRGGNFKVLLKDSGQRIVLRPAVNQGCCCATLGSQPLFNWYGSRSSAIARGPSRLHINLSRRHVEFGLKYFVIYIHNQRSLVVALSLNLHIAIIHSSSCNATQLTLKPSKCYRHQHSQDVFPCPPSYQYANPRSSRLSC